MIFTHWPQFVGAFLFGSPCRRCKGGSFAKRWRGSDGTGSWRMHHTVIGHGHRDPLIDIGDEVCRRNGWFSRHRLVTALIVFVVGFFVVAGISAARAADRPEQQSSEWFCVKARMHRAQFSSDKAAEDSARAQGASEATIAKAKRCPR